MPSEAAALEAALEALRQHTALLEGQSVLPAADEEAAGGWANAAGWTPEEPAPQHAAPPALPAYLLPGQQRQQQLGGSNGAAAPAGQAGFQTWPAWQAGAQSDAIQEADEGASDVELLLACGTARLIATCRCNLPCLPCACDA